MCGITGLFDPGARVAVSEAVLRRMTESLVHRGPDAHGYWTDRAAGLALGHRRLAIVDLSREGAQPMESATRRFVICFNGEVYNFQELRRDLEALGHQFRGHSDTEVMLAAVTQWGVQRAIGRFNGMFAFALWDSLEKRLWLARDRVGKKPLYFGLVNGALVFASELKALRVVPGFQAVVDRNALTLYLRHNYVPAPWSIYEGITKLPAGNIASFTANDGRIIGGKPECYWSPEQLATEGARQTSTTSLNDVADELETLLRDAVRMRMISDVPLGAFLSGGIDSSLIVALMQAQSAQPVRTFTIGFGEDDFNEAVHAKRVAQHLGTDHTEVYLTAQDALNVIPEIPRIYDEPFADSSQIPTYLVCREARRFVTVALSGDGGDEGFCGYNRYVWWRQIWRSLGYLPLPARQLLASALRGATVTTWDRALRPVRRLLPAELRHRAAGEKLHKLAEVLGARSPDAIYRSLVSHWKNPATVVLGGAEPWTRLSDDSGISDIDRFTDRMMLLDILTYLPDDILVKVDRASMAVSLEVRAPLLDFRVLEFAARVPLPYKLQRTSGKLVLKRILERFVPPKLFDRPKTGFGVPLESWLRGPLREWAEDLLAPARLRAEGYFAVAPVRAMWDDLVVRGRATHYLVWDILMFQAWLQQAGVVPQAVRMVG
jgi:asparagine synthase (glutamine-hydrolysing)